MITDDEIARTVALNPRPPDQRKPCGAACVRKLQPCERPRVLLKGRSVGMTTLIGACLALGVTLPD